MEIGKRGLAGTLESSDVMVEVSPHRGGIDLDVASIVDNQFGEEIDAVVREVLAGMGVTDAMVKVNDRGALECVIRARVETAVLRSQTEEGQ